MRASLRDSAILRDRTLLHYWRTPRLLIVAALQPIFFLLVFEAVFHGQYEQIHQGSYISFLVPGILVQAVIFGSTQTGIALAEDLSHGVMDRLRAAPIAAQAVLDGRITADMVRNTVVFALLVTSGYALGFRFHGGALDALLAYVLVIALGVAFSWVQAYLALVTRDVETMQIVGYIWVFPLTFLSSAFVPTETMSPWLESFAENQPVTHAVDAVRALSTNGRIADETLWTTAWIVGILLVFIPLATRRFTRLA